MVGQDDMTCLLRRAAAFARAGQMGDALSLAHQACREHPKHPQPHYVLSQLALKAALVPLAVSAAQKASELGPGQARFLLQLGRALATGGQTADALVVLAELEALSPEKAAELDALGAIYSLCDEQHRAIGLFEKAVALEPDNPHFLFNLAAAQRFLGDLEAAEATCDRVIALKPDDHRAYYIRSDLRKQAPDNNHVDELRQVLEAGSANWRGTVHLHYALAKELEDIEDYPRSFQHLQKGAALQRRHMRYDVRADIEVIDDIIASHTAEWLGGAGEGHASAEPIFVFGLPRTGTTLVERIVGAHSHVFAAGELNNFASEMICACQAVSGKEGLARNDLVKTSSLLDPVRLGSAYVESTRPRTGHTPRFVDKMPQNYLYAGLIAAALPNARLINVMRGPMDACFAMYKTVFTGAYPFTYDLDDLAQYYVAYRRLIAHWQKVLGDRMLTLSYEGLVKDQEAETRRILAYLDLPWEDACLDFHHSAAPSSTASAAQVRRPIYSSSVGRWTRHRAELQPLFEFLDREGLL